MKSRSKAPLRIGLAGGGTDVSPYTDLFGGEVVNVAISLYANCTVSDNGSGASRYIHEDLSPVDAGACETGKLGDQVYELHHGVLKRFIKEFGFAGKGLNIETRVDAPLGSGLGTSSTLVVSILGALLHHHGIHQPKERIAALAYSIEREDLKHAGGRQDQYAACFGGINHLLFEKDGNVLVNKIAVTDVFMKYLESNLILYYTRHNRYSGQIIEEQITHVKNRDQQPLEAMHNLKEQSRKMMNAFRAERFSDIAALLDQGFAAKKRMASGITNSSIEEIYNAAKKAGALAGKISGAGGGGFMIFCVAPAHQENVRQALLNFGGSEFSVRFDQNGLITWSE